MLSLVPVRISFVLLVATVILNCPTVAEAQERSVLTYHGDASRSGKLVVPSLTWEKARSVHLDLAFDGRVSGHIYAQPLYWRGGSSNGGLLLVATEDNLVQALDANTGKAVWRRSLGSPVPRSALPCGNIKSARHHRYSSHRWRNSGNLCRCCDPGSIWTTPSSFRVVIKRWFYFRGLANRCGDRTTGEGFSLQSTRSEPTLGPYHT